MERTYEDGLRDGRIEALENAASDADEQIAQLTEQMNSGFSKLGEKFDSGLSDMGESIRSEFRPTCQAVSGNGDPSRGLISRLAVVEESLAIQRWLIYCMIAAIIGGAIKLVWF